MSDSSSSTSVTSAADEETVVNLAEFLQQLSLAPDEERPRILNEISPVISKVAASKEFRKSLADANLTLLFDCFSAADAGQEEIDIVSDIILKIGEYVDGITLIRKYSICFKRGLEHSNSSVKETHLKVLRKCMNSKAGIDEVRSDPNLLMLATKCLREKELSVAKQSMAILECLSSLEGDEMLLFQPPVLPLLQEMAEDKDEIVRLRLHEVMVNVAKKSSKHLAMVAKHNFLQYLCDEVRKDDVLLQLNALELLTELAQVNQGLDYLENTKVLRELENSMDTIMTSSTGSFLIPGVVKLFGVVANRHMQDCLQLYPKFTQLLTSLLAGNDTPDQLLAIETFTHICRNPRKKILFSDKEKYGELVQLFFGRLNPLIKTGQPDSRSKGLSVLAELCVLHAAEEAAADFLGEEMNINERLLEMFDEKPLTLLMQYAKLPILEVSGMVYHLLFALAAQAWALRKFKEHPGFIEYLLDRKNIMDKQVLEVKYGVIKKAAEHVLAEDIFPEETLKKLRQYVQEGPFYSAPGVQVAYDDM